MSQQFFERHQPLLEQAMAAASLRGYWSPFAESPSPRNYGETANDEAARPLRRCKASLSR